MTNTGSVVVNRERVLAIAALLRETAVPPEAEDAITDADVPTAILPNAYFVLVAVCHQTSPVGEPRLEATIDGRLFKGWDYLREAFLRAAARDREWFTPSRLATVVASDIDAVLQIADNRVHLNTLGERAALIRDLGNRMQNGRMHSITELFDQCERTLVRPDGSGLLMELGRFRAYRDPVRKKSVFFISLMQSEELWTISDPEHLPAPVDYHEVRGHLRCGTVEICDESLAQQVWAGTDVSEEADIRIRGAVCEAISAIGAAAGLTPSRLHYLFWNVFRECCSRDSPHCHACPPDCKLPERYKVLTSERRRCLFSDVCVSRDQQRKLVEHRTQTDFY